MELARAGVVEELKRDSSLAKGLNTFGGYVAIQVVGRSLGLESISYGELLRSD